MRLSTGGAWGAPSFPAHRGKKVTCHRYAQSCQDFIRVWETSGSADDVAEALKMPKAIVHARASSYRQLGVKLKKMPRKMSKQLDVEALNGLVEELRGPRGGRGEEDGASRGRLAPTALVPGAPAGAGEGGNSPLLPPIMPPRPEVVVSAPNGLISGDYGRPNRRDEVRVLHDGVVRQGG